MNDNGDYDVMIVDNVCQIDINTCHDKSELGAVFNFNSLHKKGTKIEFKSMDSTKFTFFIEYKIDKKGNGELEDSGIITTMADKYWISINDDIDYVIRTPFLKWLYKYRNELKIEEGKVLPSTSKNWIGYGIYVPVDCIYEYQKMFVDYRQGVSIEEIVLKVIDPEGATKLATRRAQKILQERFKSK
jgi:hypothetical protein